MITALVVVVPVIVFLAIVWYAAVEMVSPPRRGLQEYHQTWLETPEKHGLRITSIISQRANSPCLIIEPQGQVSERGRILREQLADQELLPFGEVRANLVFFHGKTGRKENFLPIAERFCAVGFRCILIDLPGHGESKQKFTFYGAHEDEGKIGKLVLEEFAERYAFPAQPAHLWGMSMGGAYAAKSMRQDPDYWQAAVVICSFDSLSQVIDDQMTLLPNFTKPTAGKLLNFFSQKHCGFNYRKSEPKLWAVEVTTPVLVVHGTEDQVINIKLGKNLYESYASEFKKWLEVPGAGHEDILVTPMELYAEMTRWYFQQMN
ncbi:MAG: alpha/beta hydrolase [Akkermansiaceae bacterium]